jgi:hypothetical protein
MKRQLIIAITVFLMLLLLMAVAGYIGYDHWTLEP